MTLAGALPDRLGISQEGVQTALEIKESYRNGDPLCVPGEELRILTPENLMNHNLDLIVTQERRAQKDVH